MDSFYDGPRKPPVPTSVNSFQKMLTVPEISVIENPNIRSQAQVLKPNIKEPFFPSFNTRKQVKFEASKPPQINKDIRDKCVFNLEKENLPHDQFKRGPDLGGKTFEQIYMANVPNRHLDLSILDNSMKQLAPNNTKTIQCHNITLEKPKSLSDNRLLTLTNNDNNTDVAHLRYANSKHNLPIAPLQTQIAASNNYLRSIENTEGFSRPPPNTEIAKASPNSDEPTIKDLFRIIQQQNEQIMLLQKQVNNLRNSIQEAPPPLENSEFRASLFKDINSPKNGRSKFAFDVKATSFEVSIRPQQHKFRRTLQNDYFEPKIQEINEATLEDSQPSNLVNPVDEDISLNLKDSLRVDESYVSDVPSIQINMEEYKSSDEEESSATEIGPTFYKNLMEQVNNVLKNMQTQSECPQNKKPKFCADKSSETMNIVKQVTLQHLKNMGVNLPAIKESNEVAVSEPCENDMSFEVKQLLMKYLPDDKLAEVMNKNKQKPVNQVDKPQNKVTVPSGSEFSFATLQYMQKYNILGPKKPKPIVKQDRDPQRILDVTALKMQPKLL